MAFFAVRRVRGAAWNRDLPLRAQALWDEHARFMNRLVDDGFLGRVDDLVISGGVNVHPDEVEAVLATHPGVAEAAVAGRPDPEWGQRVAAYVVPRDPARPPSLAELRAFAMERLAAAKAPRELVLVPALPRGPSGKLLRRLLPDGEAHIDAGLGRDLA